MEKRHLTYSITTIFFSRLNTHKTITIKPRKDLPLLSLSLSGSKKNQRNEGRRRQKERGETVATSAPPPTTAGLVTPAPPHDNGRGSSAHHAALTTGPGLRLHHRSNDGRVPVEVGSSLAPLLRRQDRVFAEVWSSPGSGPRPPCCYDDEVVSSPKSGPREAIATDSCAIDHGQTKIKMKNKYICIMCLKI